MGQYGTPRRSFAPQITEVAPFNWHRGLYRIWLLLTAGWVMSWAIYWVMDALEGKFTNVFAIPIVLFGPPVALLIFAITARWAVRGFVVPTGSLTTDR
jgi:hypothetical protein